MSNQEVNTPLELPEEFKASIKEWRQLVEWLEAAKKRELELRARIASLFTSPKEGVNTLNFSNEGLQIKLNYKINRSLDEAALDAVMSELPEDSAYRQIGVLINYKPTLVLSGYRSMPADQLLIFAQAVTEKVGTPEVDIREVDFSALDPATSPNVPDYPATSPKKGRKKKDSSEEQTPTPKKTRKKKDV